MFSVDDPYVLGGILHLRGPEWEPYPTLKARSNDGIHLIISHPGHAASVCHAARLLPAHFHIFIRRRKMETTHGETNMLSQFRGPNMQAGFEARGITPEI